MEARLRKLFLQQVDAVLKEEPGRDALLRLLQIADPDLVETDLDKSKERESKLRSLKLLIHPDKHPGDKDSTGRFQKTQTFFEKCCSTLYQSRPRKKARTSPRSVDLPFEFHVQDKWPFLVDATRGPKLPKSKPHDELTISKAICYKCINFRGAIAHGRPTELQYLYSHVVENKATSAIELFASYGGSTVLETVDEIKAAIMSSGPVVSSSFCPTQEFFNASELSSCFDTSRAGQCHAVLVVGWKLSSFGELWLVRSVHGSDDIPIAMGQFNIEDEVLAPKNDFSQVSWQDPTKAIDADLSTCDDWYTWRAIDFHLFRLERLFKALDCSWSDALTNKKRFVLRNEKQKARSRWAYLTDISWNEERSKWKVSATFCE